MCFCYIIQLRLRWQAADSAICGIALLGFAILFNNVAAMCEEDNPRKERKARYGA